MDAAENSFFLKRFLFNYALRRGIDKTHKTDTLLRPKPLDSLIWAKVRNSIGLDRVSLFISGGAPMPTHLSEFLRVLIHGRVLQGYGLTETFAAGSITYNDDPNLGHVGLPLGVDFRLLPVPDTNYGPNSDPPSGELCLFGKCLFKGYYLDPEKTNEVLKDGWFSTGDIARLNPNGTLSIVDRIKALFKLAQGEYVSPEELESAYSRSKAVNQIFAHGDSRRNYPVAIVVPDVSWALSVLQKVETDRTKIAKLAAAFTENPFGENLRAEFKRVGADNRISLAKAIMEEMAKVEEGLRPFEKVKRVHVEVDLDDTLNGFNVTKGLLTPSFKLRRNMLAKWYEKEITELYNSMGVDV